jgi:hypothetical protein
MTTPQHTIPGNTIPSIMAAEHLMTHGVVVVPIMGGEELRSWNYATFRAMDDFPEYVVGGRMAQRVLGAFGALGNPSSFHHPTIRSLRRLIYKRTKPLFRDMCERLGPDHKYEMLIDRLCVRKNTFGVVSSETWHRDVYTPDKHDPRPLGETDLILGGWLNLNEPDGHTQHFVGILGSHDTEEARAASGGFALEPKSVGKRAEAQLKQQANMTTPFLATGPDGAIIVPPGHLVVFYQRILHMVRGGKPPADPSLRLFLGHRLTEEQEPLFPPPDDTGAVVRIPSGQTPPMYSANHYQFFHRSPKYRDWAVKTFRHEVLCRRELKVGGGYYYTPGTPWVSDHNRKRTMASLKDYGLMDDKYLYSDKDLAILRPRRLKRRREATPDSDP